MADMQNNTTQTAEYEQTKRANMRKLTVVALLCLLCIVLLLIGLSRAKYRTPEMRGQGDYEPALFNTVLLGDLTTADQGKLTNLSNEDKQTYTLANGKKTTITGKKLSESLDLSLDREIGHGNYSGIRPGESKEIPFTVTNGTTVESGEDKNRNKVANVAQSDIRYKLYIRTTQNLPLTYTLIDLDDGETYTTQENVSETANLGKTKEYVVADTSDKAFVDGSRILKWTGNDSITVHRYKLKVTWDKNSKLPEYDDKGNEVKDNKGNTVYVSNTDTRYMKEIENIEVRLEIESYVNYNQNPTSTDNDIVAGVLTLKASDVDTYYTTPDSMGTIHSQKTVRYDSFGDKSVTVPDEKGTGYAYSFFVENGERTGATWDDTEKQYKVNGTFRDDKNLKVAIAVPTGEAGVGSDMDSDVSYYIEYDGKVYEGKASESNVTTNVWTKQETSESPENSHQYDYVMQGDQPAYKVIHFDELKLDFDSDYDSKELKLYMVDAKGKYHYHNPNSKDDFRIYVY